VVQVYPRLFVLGVNTCTAVVINCFIRSKSLRNNTIVNITEWTTSFDYLAELIILALSRRTSVIIFAESLLALRADEGSQLYL
jgi:hypothetical protein